jgi:hypothetical protein
MLILEPASKISFWKAFHPLMIGFMLNCILPGRVGEVARPAILQKTEIIFIQALKKEEIYNLGRIYYNANAQYFNIS